MSRGPALILVAALGAWSVAQEAATPPRRSIADGLVRQLVEIGKLKLPTAEHGLEIGHGEGPLVVVVRRADGSLDVQELDRGPGDHGETPAKNQVDQPEEVEVTEQQGPAAAAEVKVASLRITRKGEELAVGPVGDPRAWSGKAVAREPLLAQLRAEFERTKGSKSAGSLLLEVNGDAFLQELLSCWDLARQVGFTALMLSPSDVDPSGSKEARAVLRDLPVKYKWKFDRVPGIPQKVTDGELLFAVDGPMRVREIAPWFVECARTGIWRLGFVCQKDAKTRVKLATNLPFDRGR